MNDGGLLLSVTLAVIAGLAIEMFFQLVKYRDALNTEPPRVKSAHEASLMVNYLSIPEYMSGGSRKWLNYFAYRLLPPAVVFLLLAGVLDKYLDINSYWPFLMIAGVVSIAHRDIRQVFSERPLTEKLLYGANILLILALALAVSLISQYVDISAIAPNIGGLIDNLWSSLLVAMLVIFYFNVTNMGTNSKDRDQIELEVAMDNYILRSYEKIHSKHGAVIDESCSMHGSSRVLMYSILIHESINRPGWIRTIENIIVRVFRKELTLGIAQVRSSTPITDEESIRRAAKILNGSAPFKTDGNFSDTLTEILKKYNSGPEYKNSIQIILFKLKSYIPDLAVDE